MWERAILKERAKKVLSGSYWKAFLVSMVVGLFTGGAGSAATRNRGGDFGHGPGGYYYDLDMLIGFLIVVALGLLILMVVTMVINVFIGHNIRVGGMRYFVQAAQDDVNMGYLGYGFKRGRYMGIVKTMLWRQLFQFLWSLLLIIPGIIKKYSYYMVPYILADNPNIGYKRALKLSMQMMNGEKWNLFVLRISFIGWYLLGMLACGVGVLFVVPYQQSTEAELYLYLRDQAVKSGLCDYRELNLKRKTIDIEME